MPKKLILIHPEGHENAGAITGVVRFTFEDESVQEVDVFALPEAIQKHLAVHGASQKIGDSYAGAKAEENPLAFAKESVKGVIDQLVAGIWRAAREGGGGPRVSDLTAAWARVSGDSVEASAEFIGSLSADDAKALRKKPKVAAALAAIAAEKAVARAAKLAEDAQKAEAA